MSTYILTYRAPKGYAPGAPEVVAEWRAFFDGLGANLAERGNPVFARTATGDCGPDTELGGYSIVTADDMDSAVALAKGCPFVDAGGGVEVGQLTFLTPSGGLS